CCTGGISAGLPTISMRAAASSTKLSSGITDRIARAARAVVTPSTRSSLPNRVWRAIESAGKLVSHSTSVSPCPMARSAYSMSAFSSGSMFLSNAPSRIFDVSCSAAKPRRLLAVGNPDVLHLHGMPQQDRPLGGGRVAPIGGEAVIDQGPLEITDRQALR